MSSINLLLRNPQSLAALAAGGAALVGVSAYLVMRRRPTPGELEERRRTHLATHGRIIDGTLIDSAPETSAGEVPQALIYRYRISGVTYECGQDISALTTHVPDLGPATILYGTPVQVRYNRHNPADSIIIAETWNGLWNQNHSHANHEHG